MREKSEVSNFIRHRVRIRLEGFKPERLISRAMEAGAVFRNIYYKDETEIYLTASAEGLKLLTKLAGSRYKITVMKESGSVPKVKKLRNSKMAIAGFLLFLLVFLSQAFLFGKSILSAVKVSQRTN